MQISDAPRTAIAGQALRFGIVGVLATGVHAGVGALAVRGLGMPGLQASALGYLCAWWISFLGHYRFTFRSRQGLGAAFLRFVPHSLALFLLSFCLTALVALRGPELPQTVLPVLGAVLVPVLSFLSSKFLVFRG